MEIIWTLTAKNTFKNNIKYLLKEWSKKEVDNFINEVYKELETLSEYPLIGTLDEDLKCRKFVIVKQITLLYNFEGNNLYLLNFWNNYQKPLKKLL